MKKILIAFGLILGFASIAFAFTPPQTCSGSQFFNAINSGGTFTCGTPSGSGTVTTGLQGQFPFYNANGTTLTPTSTIFITQQGNIDIGTTTNYNRTLGPGNVSISNSLTVGSSSLVAQLPNDALNAIGNRNDYTAFNCINQNGGSSASCDHVWWNNLTTATTYYADAGFDSSTYNVPSFGNLNVANGWYLYNTDGPITMALATTTSAAYYSWSGQGFSTEFMRLSNSGLLGVGSTTPGSLLSIGANGTGVNFVDNGTTTFSGKGINLLKGGCFAIQGICITSGTSGLSSYDAFTHPAAGQSATTSLMLLNGQASSTGFSANFAAFGSSATTTITAAGLVGVGTTTPFAQLSINDAVAQAALVVGSSTNTEFIVDQNGLVAIGTAYPGATLSLVGVVSNTNTLGGISVPGGPSNSQISFAPAADSLARWGIRLSQTLTDLNFDYRKRGGTISATLLTLSRDGVIGIGTTTPSLLARLSSASTTNSQLLLEGADTDVGYAFRSIGNNLYISTTSPTTYATSSIAALTIDTNGKVTANCFTNDGSTCITGGSAYPFTPGTFLNTTMPVSATSTVIYAKVGLAISSTTDPIGNLGGVNGNGKWPLIINNPTSLVGSSTGLAFSISSAPSAGDGFGVIGAGIGFVRTGTGSSGDMFFSTTQAGGNNTERMRITATGNIGIGTTTPSAVLVSLAASTTAGTVATAYTGVINIIAGLENTTAKLFQVIDQWGHLIVSGDAVTLTACTGGSVGATSNDRSGSITLGTGLTTCGVLFAHPYPSGSTVHVFVNEDSGTIIGFDAQSISTAGFTIAAASVATGDVVSYTVIATQ